MEAKSLDRKTYQVTENVNPVGEVKYKNNLFMKADITLETGDLYSISPSGFIGTRMIVTKGTKQVASLHMNWRGHIVINYGADEYILKAVGMLGNTYTVHDSREQRLMTMNSKFNWRKFVYNFDIRCDQQPPNHLLVALGVYAANYLIWCMSGVF